MDVPLRVGEVLLGLSLLYFRFCLYESEQETLQNWLVDLWKRVSAQSRNVSQQTLRLLDETIRIALSLFDRVFGARTFSVKMVVVAYAFAVGSLFLGSMPMALSYPGFRQGLSQPGIDLDFFFYLFIGLGALFVIAGLLPALVQRWWALVPAGVLLVGYVSLIVFTLQLMLAVAGIPLADVPMQTWLAALSPFAALLLAPVIDMLWVIANRAALIWAHQQHSLFSKVSVLAISLVLAAGAWYLYPDRESFFRIMFADASSGVPVLDAARQFFLQVILTRTFLVAVAVAQSVVLLILILHRLVWPFLARIVYAAQRYQIFRDRKLFGTVGTALLVHGIGTEWIRSTLQALGL